MALTRVQTRSGSGSDDQPTFSWTTPVTPAQNDLLVFTVAANESASDVELSNIPAGWQLSEDSNKSGGCRTWTYWKRADASEPTTVTLMLDANVNWTIVAAQYHDSQGGTWGLDKRDQSQGHSTTGSSGNTAATAFANEVWFAAIANVDGSDNQSAPTNGFSLAVQTSRGSGSGGIRLAAYEKIVSATGVAGTQVTISGNDDWAGSIQTFFSNIAGGGGIRQLTARQNRLDRVRRRPTSKLRKPTVELVVPYPSNTVAPAITGLVVVGQTLNLSNGTWIGSPTAFTYQWYRDGHGDSVFAAIPGATTNTYTLTDDDDYRNIMAVVTAYNARGQAAANSNTVGLVVEPAPVIVVSPSVDGLPIVGLPLTADPGTWLHMGGYPPVTYFTYQWQRSSDGGGTWTNISPSGDIQFYWPGDIDLGDLLRVCVVPHNSGLP